MKFMLTGASGFLGSHLALKLAHLGHQVHALMREPEKASPLNHPNITLFKGDLSEPSSLLEAMKGCHSCYHIAACAKVWVKQPETYFKVNVQGTSNVLDAARYLGLGRTVFVSTAGTLGPSLSNIVTEKSKRSIDFFNEYESSKAIAESMVKDAVLNGLDVVIASPTRIYGPYLFGNPESVTLLIQKYVTNHWRMIPGDGSKIGNYVFVDDVVNGLILAMEKGRKGHTYLIGGTNHDYNEFFQVLSDLSGIKRTMVHVPIGVQLLFARLQLMKAWLGGSPSITPGWVSKGLYDWEVSCQKAKEELGYVPRPLEEGLYKTIQWASK